MPFDVTSTLVINSGGGPGVLLFGWYHPEYRTLVIQKGVMVWYETRSGMITVEAQLCHIIIDGAGS